MTATDVRLEELERDPHPLLARLREREPVSWVPELDGWLVTRRDLALHVMREPETFTVDDPRFSTRRVVGLSMLTLDGADHERHRAPFAKTFRLHPVRERFTPLVAAEVARLIDAMGAGRAELRRDFAGPLAATTMAHALGLEDLDRDALLGWYGAIVAAVTEVTAGKPVPDSGRAAFDELRAAIEGVLDGDAPGSLLAAAAGEAAGLGRDEVVSNAAVLLFGGVDTTEGAILNLVLHLLEHPDQLALVRRRPELLAGALEESLRLEPAAAVIDRYATRDVTLGPAEIRAGDLVSVSIAAANRDPAAFEDPDRFLVTRENAGRHVAFAHGPHVCIGMHLARLEVHSAVGALLERLPNLRLDPERPTSARGLVFRKPPALHVLLDGQ